jgi:hypothetical protein
MNLKSKTEILEAIAAQRRVISHLEQFLRKAKNTSSLSADTKKQYEYECYIEIKNIRISIGTLMWILNNYEKNKKTSHLGLYEVGYLIDEAVTKMKNGESFNFLGKRGEK